MQPQKVFISGARGFIGSRLTKALTKIGFIVEAFDKADGDDVRDPAQINNAFHHFKPDVVIHLAMAARPVASLSCIPADMGTNIVGTVNLLEACDRHNVTKFIFPSSAATNGGNPTSPHGISKMAAEKYVEFYGKHTNLDAIVFRFQTIWGEGGQSVADIFMRAKAAGEKVEIYGNGLRDFIHIDDVIDLFVKAVQADPAAGFRLFSVGVDPMEVVDLADMIGVEYTMRPVRAGEIFKPDFVDNSNELVENFDWQQKIKIRGKNHGKKAAEI